MNPRFLRECALRALLGPALTSARVARRSAWHLLALFFGLGLSLWSAPAAAMGNPWYWDPNGTCGGQLTADSPEGIAGLYYDCVVAVWNQDTSVSYTYTVDSCQTTQAKTYTAPGSAQCNITSYRTDASGTSVYSHDITTAAICSDDRVYVFDPVWGPGCAPVDDRWHFCFSCAFGNPIYPLTGTKAQSEDLGMSLAGRPLKITYDTTPALPLGGGQVVNMTLQPPPSFGPLWSLSAHRQLFLETRGGPPMSDYGSAVVRRGAVMSSFGIDRQNSCTQAAGGQSGTSNAYLPTTEHGLQLTFDVPSSPQSPARLLDGPGLVEESYDGGGLLTKAAYAGGGWVSYAYSTGVIPGVAPAAGLLLTATDHAGRTVSFIYEQPDTHFAPRIKTITAADGAVTQFAYDAKDNLATITWPDTAFRKFRYELPAIPWALTGITDESSAIYSSYGYDSSGRATSTHLATDVDGFVATYDAPPRWEVTEIVMPDGLRCRDHHMVPPSGTSVTQVTEAGNVTTSLGAVSVNGLTKMHDQNVPLGNGVTATTTQAFDANGNVASVVDRNGNLSCYYNDLARDLEIVRLEGLPGKVNGAPNACPVDPSTYTLIAPGGAGYDPTHPQRKITTEWLANWSLPTRVAEPGKITTTVYNSTASNCAPAAPLLPDGSVIAVACSRTEQATTDVTGQLGLSATPTGAARTWKYTYDQFGQVATEIAPKQVSTDPDSKYTTTYAYYTDTSFPDGVSGHAIGDLMSVTNPLGQVTQYTSYDKAGRLLSSKDVNNVVTTRSYWPRGWLHTQTVTPAAGAAQTTTFAYYPTGLLNVVTLPDTTQLSYTYDDAHRLTDVHDGANNHVHYDYDTRSNRTGEQVTDSSGRLAGAVARVFDALNRVQSVTGAAH